MNSAAGRANLRGTRMVCVWYMYGVLVSYTEWAGGQGEPRADAYAAAGLGGRGLRAAVRPRRGGDGERSVHPVYLLDVLLPV